jgi:adenosylcobinamide-phosphate synthase
VFAHTTRQIGIAAGWLADVLIGDPRRGHPVALFGRLATLLERATYRDTRSAGMAHTGVSLVALGVAAEAMQRFAARLGPAGRVAVMAAATWTALGGTSLARTGRAMAELLAAGDVAAARRLLPSLCGRDPDVLDAPGLTRAALESVAENTSDAHVAPLVWAAVGGVPAVLGYRGVNTLDAIVGHRSPRYLRFGWAAARLDDVANYAPARLTAILVTLCAPAVGGSSSGALRAWRSDAARHPSPNAGVVEAAFAGALGLRLGGPTRYAHVLQIRPTLGTGREPTVADLRRAVRLSRLVQVAALAASIALAATIGAAQRRRP